MLQSPLASLSTFPLPWWCLPNLKCGCPARSGSHFCHSFFIRIGAMPDNKRILALVSDLLFTVKISDAAKRNGMLVEYAKTDSDFLDKAKSQPNLIIMDLNISSAEPVKLINQIKSDSDLRRISVLSYVSHVQGELKLKAQEAGSDLVMARSAFSQNLSQILKRHAGPL